MFRRELLKNLDYEGIYGKEDIRRKKRAIQRYANKINNKITHYNPYIAAIKPNKINRTIHTSLQNALRKPPTRKNNKNNFDTLIRNAINKSYKTKSKTSNTLKKLTSIS